MPTGVYKRKKRGPGRPKGSGRKRAAALVLDEGAQALEIRTALDGMIDRLLVAATAKARAEGHAQAMQEVSDAEERRLKAIQG